MLRTIHFQKIGSISFSDIELGWKSTGGCATIHYIRGGSSAGWFFRFGGGRSNVKNGIIGSQIPPNLLRRFFREKRRRFSMMPEEQN